MRNEGEERIFFALTCEKSCGSQAVIGPIPLDLFSSIRYYYKQE